MSEDPTIRRVALALFEGFTVLDMYGPVQAFASCRVPTSDGSFKREYIWNEDAANDPFA